MAELIIVFREVLEASLIIGILYTFLVQKENLDALKQLWRGVYLALFASVVGSVLFQQLIGGFEGRAEKLFEGIVMIIASATLATMIIWMAKNQNIANELREKAEDSISNDKLGIGIFSLAFIAVFREGIETILFLYGIFIKEGNVSIILSFVGAALGVGVGYLIFVKGKSMPVKSFFHASSILLIFVASGMLAYGVHELESADVIPYYSGKVEVKENSIIATRISGYSKTFDLNSEKKAKKWSSRIWDINPQLLKSEFIVEEDCPIDHKWNNKETICYSYPLFHDKGTVGQLIKGLFGYNGDPSLFEFLVWLASLFGFFYLYNKSRQRPAP